MIEQIPGSHRITIAAGKAYDTRDFVANQGAMGATPHVAQYGATGHRGSATVAPPATARTASASASASL